MAEVQYRSFEEFYPFYLTEHRRSERGVPEQPSLWERSPCDWPVRVFSSVSSSE